MVVMVVMVVARAHGNDLLVVVVFLFRGGCSETHFDRCLCCFFFGSVREVRECWLGKWVEV